MHDTAKELVRAWQMRMLRLIEMQRPQDFVKNIPPSAVVGSINFAPPPKPSQPIRPPDRIMSLLQPRSISSLHHQKPPMPPQSDPQPPKPNLLLENFHSRAFKIDHSRNDSLAKQTSKNNSSHASKDKSGFVVDISTIPNANDTSLEVIQSQTSKTKVKNLLSSKSLISTMVKKQNVSPSQAQAIAMA